MDTEEDRRLLLTVPDAAAVLAVGRTTLYELIATSQLATVHIGRAVRVRIDGKVDMSNGVSYPN